MLKDRIECGALALSRAVRELYAAQQTDYSMEPLVLADEGGEPVGRIHAGDGVIFCCRRGEREVELTEAFTDPGFDRFPRPDQRDLTFVILTLYHEKFKDLPVAFAPARIPDTLAEVISRAGLQQLHTSESEKFAHVTFFFNGGNNEPFPAEQDVSVPSLRGVPFEQAPALSLPQVAQEVLRGIHEGVDFIAANFANGDVIGHTANREAKLACASIVDRHLGSVADAALARGYVVFVTADHGNLEELVTPEGKPHVSHTTNPVSLILLDPRVTGPVYLRDGKLADVAPSVLAALDIPQPAAMTGANLAPD
ncbi:MAG: phosphoglycerate mutase (2,3-diphosphoglycerate-independent), partial [Bacteroidota bacterium]